jgi:hypothetical protein
MGSRRISRGQLLIVVSASLCVLCATPALAAGDANRQHCSESSGTESSPGFRSYLPDCRAYELVTPPYEGSQPPRWTFGAPPPVSADGQHLLGLDLAGFAGTENEEQNGFEVGAIYEFSRTPSGWSTESLEPPASLAGRRGFVTASTDLSHSLWELAIQSSEGEEVTEPTGYTYAVREVIAGGGARFVGVGPSDSPTAPGHPNELRFGGASGDLTHILFAIAPANAQQFWPGDRTRAGAHSLYEYVGTGNREPVLVGVKNAGALGGKAHLNEGAELVSECGTILGSAGEGSAYNAVSVDGAVVYFTALHVEGCSGSQPTVNEVYARISGSQTVAISEPPPADCKLCDTSSRRSAVFQGASDDGSKMFFLSEQKLLAGAKGENLYEYDFHAEEGKRVALISADVAGVARISEDGSHAFYVANDVLTTRPNGNGEAAREGDYNLYAYDTSTGKLSFVAILVTRGEEQELGQELMVNCGKENPAFRKECEEAIPRRLAEQIEARTGVTRQDSSRPFEASFDGGFLVFTNARRLTGGEDTSTVGQVFEYNTQREKLVRASIGECPAPATECAFSERTNNNGNTTNSENAAKILAPNYLGGLQPTEAASARSLSEAGAVAFTSADALTPQAIEGRENVYSYEPEGVGNCMSASGCVYVISAGDEAVPLKAGAFSRLLGMDRSGSDVFFFTTDSLVPQDTDTQASWYDARIGGGFPAPVSPAGCLGDACQGPLSATPATPSAGSTGTAEGNLAPPLSNPVVRPKPLTRAQKLAKALKACKKKPTRQRAACAKRARKQYAPAKKKVKGKR